MTYFWTFSVPEAGKLEPQELHLDMIAEADRATAEEKGATQRVCLTGANKRMFNLLKKAKVQLNKIDQQKQLKSSGVIIVSLIKRIHFKIGMQTVIFLQ